MYASQHAAKDIKGVRRISYKIWFVSGIGPGSAKHEAVLKWMVVGVTQVLLSKRLQIFLGIIKAISAVKILRKALKATPHDFREQVIAARVVLIRSLMRNPKLACDLAQAQVLNAAFSDYLLRSDDTGVSEFQRWRVRAFLSRHTEFLAGSC